MKKKKKTYSVSDLYDWIEWEGGIFAMLEHGLPEDQEVDHPKVRKALEALADAYKELGPLFDKFDSAMEEALAQEERRDIDEEE